MTSPVIDLSTSESPDVKAIVAKKTIDISLSEFDVSASLISGSLPLDSITLNRSNQKIVLLDDNSAGVYFTPIYTEKLNYSEWQRKANKTFEELEV